MSHYKKLFKECPFLENMPELENTIVAGGIINVALDNELDYISFPTSDIDIFVAGPNGKKRMTFLHVYQDFIPVMLNVVFQMESYTLCPIVRTH